MENRILVTIEKESQDSDNPTLYKYVAKEYYNDAIYDILEVIRTFEIYAQEKVSEKLIKVIESKKI